MTIVSEAAQFSKALRGAVFWPMGIIFATALLLLLFVFELFEVVSWSEHSYEVLALTRRCEDLLVSTQNDVRGFLLTNDRAFIKQYQARQAEADTDIAKLRNLVSDNPDQSIRADDISRAKVIWYEHANTMIAQRTQNLPTNPDWVRMGGTIMGELESRFDRFTEAELALGESRQQKVWRMKETLIGSGVALAILISLSIAHVIRKQMMQIASTYRTALETSEHRLNELARSERDLEEQKEWLRVTLISIGDGVIVTDQSGRLIMMNHEAERLTGWTQADALHQPLPTVFRIVNEESRNPVTDPVAKVLEEKKVVGLANHTVLLSRSNEEWPIEDSAAPILGPNQAVQGVVLVFHDASGIRMAQKSLKAYSVDLEKKVADRTLKLQQMVSELESYSYSVSHDLRAPLRAMQGFSEALIEDYGEKLDDRGKNYLERIKNAANRLDRLIQDLLSYTRISRQDNPLEEIDLDRTVREVIAQDANLNPFEGAIRVEGTLPKVMGQPTSLTQVVANLLGNAVKFVAPDKKPEIRIHAEDRGEMVRLWVEDNGIGIPPQDQERIFNMFIQTNEPSRYGGTGIGLAIVKKAMQTMQGAVGVESNEGSGSRFWVDLNKVA